MKKKLANTFLPPSKILHIKTVGGAHRWWVVEKKRIKKGEKKDERKGEDLSHQFLDLVVQNLSASPTSEDKCWIDTTNLVCSFGTSINLRNACKFAPG